MFTQGQGIHQAVDGGVVFTQGQGTHHAVGAGGVLVTQGQGTHHAVGAGVQVQEVGGGGGQCKPQDLHTGTSSQSVTPRSLSVSQSVISVPGVQANSPCVQSGGLVAWAGG